MDKKIFVENKSIKIWDKFFKTLVIFLILITPTISFIIVYYMNPAINFYFNYFILIEKNFGPSVIVTKMSMLFFMWAAFAIFILTLIFIFLIPFIFGKKIKLTIKVAFTILITLLLILSIIFSSISEYNYSRFHVFYIFLAKQNINKPFVEELFFLQKKFSEIYYSENGINIIQYRWTSDTFTWWICIFKIMVIIIYFAILLNSLEIKKQEKIEATSIRKNLDQSKLSYFLNKLVINNSKNISAWLISATFLVFLPQLIFISIMSIFNSEINSLLNWSTIAPDLIKSQDVNLSSLTNSNVSNFIIKSLPIIISGFLMGTICIFFLVYTKGWNTNNLFFKLQFLIMFIEIILIISITTYSSNQIQHIVEIWNDNKIGIELNKYFAENNEIFLTLKEMLGTTFINSNNIVKNPWLSGLQYASQSIISISFILTVYIILGFKLLKINKKF
ncbi:hypothetical protein [Spiroplasma taiwanense]|uniref:Transmembrane protein n=1 Tax=Spiroplasma taiwanense CT-1 TaxID=1276220 RepID=S5M0W0_9MOLU|nr:hypothetical protein [Spiroplasma taiwanense]AGR41642.1 hypothetical protein STAIW_v1c10590 [Spiroplasma taiwanense CT-1]